MNLGRPDANAKTVYSTDPAALEREQEKAATSVRVSGATGDAKSKVARMRLEKKGRAGKAVTVVAGLMGTQESLKELAKELKALCGAGGTLKGDRGAAEIEIQGDHRDKLETRLRELGYSLKRVGG